jgi:hypothetical protein
VQKEEQQQFWISISGMNGAESAEHWDVFVQTQEATTEFFKDGGEYLPLGVWAVRGFNVAAIELGSRPSDVMEDPVLGTVYRVRILQKGNSGTRGTVVTKNLKRKAPMQALPPSGASSNGAGSSGDGGFTVGGDGPMQAIQPPPMAALLDGAADSDSDSSSTTTSSSSSSSGDKKKKKHKKGKKGKKGKKDKKSKKSKKDKKEQKDVCHSCPVCSSCSSCSCCLACPSCPSCPYAILAH